MSADRARPHPHLRRAARRRCAKCWPPAFGPRTSTRTSTRTCCRPCWSGGADRRGVSNSLGAPPVRSAAPRRRRSLEQAAGEQEHRIRAPPLQRTLAANGCRTTDHFAGFQITGRYDAAELAALIRSLPDGVTEFMCHPGFCTAELEASRTRLKESRRRELDALTSREARAALDEAAVKLASYREIA